MANVRLEGVHKNYGAVDILRNIELDIRHGEFVVFVGPSGSGKSTLLRMIGGLERISDGRLFIDDQMVNNVDAADRNLGMVFQSYALYPHLSVRENLAFPLRMAKLSREQIRSKVGQVAELLQIEELLERKPRQLSGGQRQRVAIGRAIVREPKVFLFDEPLSNLDTELRVQMRVQIAKLHRQIGNTMIYVTHDQVEAMTMADKIVVLRAGNIEQIGTPQELYHQPATQFVAGFIGSPRMNFLKCAMVRAEGSNCVVRLENGREATLPISPEGLTAGQPLVLGIRPDDFIEPSALPDGVLIDIDVDFVEHLGSATYFYGMASGENIVARAPDRHRHVGTVRQLELAIAPRDCHLFTHDGRALQRLETPQSWS